MAPAAPSPRLPPPLTESTPVLISRIPLPPAPLISYAKYVTVVDDHHQHKTLELARQCIINSPRQGSKGVLDSLLPIVSIGGEDAALWVFAIGSGIDSCAQSSMDKGKGKAPLSTVQELEQFAFDGLQRSQLSRFLPSTIYPCSLECANAQVPCTYCSQNSPELYPRTPPSLSFPSTILPRASLKPVYSLFRDAVRDRLVDDICAASTDPKASASNTQTSKRTPRATRLGNGFLSIDDDALPLWGAGWEHRSRKRPLVHTALHIWLSPTTIHIRPLPTLSTLLSMPIPQPLPAPSPSKGSPIPCTPCPPLTPGLPLILAPYQTPAYYVSTHTGTSIPASLLAQFWDALMGLGAYSLPKRPRVSSSRSLSSTPITGLPPSSPFPATLMREPFVLVFVPISNPQGEPKRLTALWPAHLVFIDTSTSRSHLTNLPEMPETDFLLTPPRGPGSLSTASSLPAVTSPRTLRQHRSSRLLDRVGQTQRAFRALELSSHKRVPGAPIPSTAKKAAGYVESVAREREKERERANQERVRRERDLKEGKSSGPGPPMPISVSTNIAHVSQTSNGTPAAGPLSSKTPIGLTRSTSATVMMSNFFAKAAQGTEANSFYPSPPDWDPIASTSGSGGVAEISSMGTNATMGTNSSGENDTSSNSQPNPGANVASQDMGEALDLGDLGMDIDMNMGISLNEPIGFDMAVDMDATGIMDGTFGSFTDDDFNYFDSVPAAAISISAPHMESSLHDLGEDVGVDGWLTNGLKQEETDASHNLRHTATSVTQEGTPASVAAGGTGRDSLMRMSMRMSEDDDDLLPAAPDLVPSSPAKSPWSPGNPPTPSLELNASFAPTVGKGMFDPIAFGKSHRLADGKYRDAWGKFAFPQSPHISHSFVIPASPSSLNSDRDDGWRLRYDAVTDPRVGVVKRLRGIKRKLPQTISSPYSKSVRGHARDEEWASLYGQDNDTELLDSSSSESENDLEELEHGQDRDDDASSSHPSRPSTPPPPGLPLTATLLYTQFNHTHLLPIGISIRNAYRELLSSSDPSPLPISVPTPVSPAAALGNASERNKTLELLAQAIAKEAVENHVWAEAWALSPDALLDENPVAVERRVSQTDLRRISDLLGKVDGLLGSMPLSDLLEPPSSTSQAPPIQGNKLQLMPPPWLSIGRAGLVQHMLPPAIRFWEKEGLGPRGGAKDVVAFALFEEGDERSALVEKWMERVSRAYNARGLGTHVAGNAGPFERGLVPLQFEAVRKTLPNLMLDLPPEPPHIVLYIVAPPSVLFSFKSPALRTIIMSQKRVPKLAGQHDFDQDRILVHFVPDYLVTDPYTYPSTRYVGLERFVTSVYDRLLRPTFRQTSRQFWECSPPFENRFQVPAFVLARKTPPQTHLEWDERPSLNVLDRHTFLQVGYRVSACGKWLLAACIDERGEAHDVAVWGVPDAPAMSVNWVVSNIWIFVKQFAQRADTEWRIVVTKLGEMGESEVEVWMSHLETVASAYPGPPVHVSLVCAQNDMPLSFMSVDGTSNPPSNTHVSTHSNGVFADVSAVTYSAFLPQRTPIISPDLFFTANHPSLIAPLVPEDEPDQLPPKSPIGVLPLCTTALFRVPKETDLTTVSTLYIHLLHAYKSAKSTLKRTTQEVHADITRNWHELTILTGERWNFAQHGGLPFHLGALQVMSDVLNRLASAPDMTTKEADFLGG